MKRSVILVISAAALLGAAGSAAAAPSWCKGASFSDDLDLRDLASSDPTEVVFALAQASCAPSAEAEASRYKLESARRAWGEKLGMADGDWAEVIAWLYAGSGRSVKLDFSTRAIHHGYDPADHQGAVAPPVYLTSTYTFPTIEETDAAAARGGLLYAREHNPTTELLEARRATLDIE